MFAMKIVSWNVNGIRAVAKKGYWDWFKEQDADIICLQETKAFQDQLDAALACPPGYHSVWHAGEKPGYAGTVTFSKKEPITHTSKFEEELAFFHEEGRVVETKFPSFTLLNIYFPNGGTRANGEERLTFKLYFYAEFLNYIDSLRTKGEKVIVCGDYNICHTEIDIARPKANENSIGFLPIEREWIDRLVEHGWIDVFRHFNPDAQDAYTWWSYRAGTRPNNVGWRIDYFFVSPDLIDKVTHFEHQTEVMGSDHCPVMMEIEV